MPPSQCSNCHRPVEASALRTCGVCQSRFCSRCARILDTTNTSCPICPSEPAVPSVSVHALDVEPQWYEAQPGQERLAKELAEIQRRGLVGVSTSILPDRRLALRFPLRDGAGAKFFTVITQSNHPTSYPQVVLECEDSVTFPTQDSSGMARHLYESVERSQALDRYQRAVCSQPVPVVEYFAAYRYGSPPLVHEDQSVPWYETPSGKTRLADEVAALNNARLVFESRRLASGNLVFVVDGALLKRPNPAVAIFPPSYPRECAQLTVGNESVQSSAPVDRGRPPFLETAPLLVEVIARLLGETW